MKGIMFNLLEDFIIANSDEDTFEAIYEKALPGLKTKDPFVGPATYPNEDFLHLATVAVETLGLPMETALFEAGKFAFPKLVAVAPKFAADHKHPKSFLMTVHDVIHVEVRKMYDEPQLPTFNYQEPSDETLIMDYHSDLHLHDLAEGLIQGTADYFKVPIVCKKEIIKADTEQFCRFHLTFN